MTEVYQASHIKPKRKRATAQEMDERRQFCVEFAEHYQPVTVRQVFYAATVHGFVPKTDSGYNMIQTQCLQARRDGDLAYSWITDSSRGSYLLQQHANLSNAAIDFAGSYRRDFWHDSPFMVEVWLEKEALAGTLLPVTQEYRVRMVPSRGLASETSLWDAVDRARRQDKSKIVIITLYDFDAAGEMATTCVINGIRRLSEEYASDIEVEHISVALTYDQVMQMALPTREAKRKSPRDQKWTYDFACELDAVPPNELRRMLSEPLEKLMPMQKRAYYEMVEENERRHIRMALMDVA